MTSISKEKPFIVLSPEDHVVLGPSDFGMPGLIAIEAIGPFQRIQACGPLITVHDSLVEAGLGIGHHPHRYNERLFYIEEGELDHDDALNNISGHMATGDVGQFIEGQRGIIHSEWNNGDIDTRAYILVYSTDPIPAKTDFNVLEDEDAPRYEEGAGVKTKELVGPKSSLKVNGDIRLFAESQLEPGASVKLDLASGEGGVVSVREGAVRIEPIGDDLAPGSTLVLPPLEEHRSLTLSAVKDTRVIRVVHGPGHGFLVTEEPMARRSS